MNTRQAAAWNGYEGTHWARHQKQYDDVNSGYNEPLLAAAAIQPYDQVLDVGCGNGESTRLAARRAVHGHVTGLDLSGPMLERARVTAVREGVDNVSFLHGDAQVYPIPERSFDVAISRFGIMFFAAAVAGFTNIARGLRPGGRVAFLAMGTDPLDGLQVLFRRISGDLPGIGPSDDRGGPLSLSDPAYVREVLGAAGFRGITSTRVDADQYWGDDADAATEFLWGWGPVRHHWSSADSARATRAHTTLRAAMEDYATPDGVRLPSHGWLVTAERG
ncbi:methyltransferase domain-containing protein [Spiractinospora alimapuensis]|nr:class I SAM-dependent methyltransferase [Spiractinospora alimapuensis]QVQ53819.1 methyltransferase domain-containing protein [Spiractinospora alimapuensis]